MSEQKIKDCSAVILAGGKNSRYGGFHKAFLRFENEFLIQRDLNLLSSLFDEVIIVTNQIEMFTQFDVPVFPDIFKERGPLAGIHSALTHINTEAAFIVGCDMPFLNKELIQKVYRSFKSSPKDFCIPSHKGMIEPLHGIYSKKSFLTLENFLYRNNYNAVHRFLSNQEVEYLEFDLKKEEFLNINSPEDLNKIQ